MHRIDAQVARNEEVTFGFTLHDVGKIGVPDAILTKPGPLNDVEWTYMRRHPELGVKIVQPIGFSSAATDIILWHHERWDGNGYPHGLRAEEIPLTARAFAVADGYDAMTSDRPYRAAMSSDDALAVIHDESGAKYDPEMVRLFTQMIA
jgi:putative two-component system response regulator